MALAACGGMAGRALPHRLESIELVDAHDPDERSGRWALAPGSTLEVHVLGVHRHSDHIGVGAFYPQQTRLRAGDAVVAIDAAERDRLSLRGLAAGEAAIELAAHGERAVVTVRVAPAVRASIELPIAGLEGTALQAVVVAGSEIDLPITLLDATGARVRGRGAIALDGVRVDGPARAVAIDDRHLRLAALGEGSIRVELLGATLALDAVGAASIASIHLDVQSDDTNLGYGCIAPAPALDAPVRLVTPRWRHFVLARARSADGRVVLGALSHARSLTPDVCAVPPTERPGRARRVLEIQHPASRGFVTDARDVVPLATGACVIETTLGDATARIEVDVATPPPSPPVASDT